MNISVVMLQQSSLTIIVDVSIIVYVASVITAVVDASTTIFVFINRLCQRVIAIATITIVATVMLIYCIRIIVRNRWESDPNIQRLIFYFKLLLRLLMVIVITNTITICARMTAFVCGCVCGCVRVCVGVFNLNVKCANV